MNTYSPQSVGVTAPAEGFKEGGWYGGRQYFAGTLSDKGVIHPNSPQQGSGQKVSDEVNAQSAQAQGKTLPEFKAYLGQGGKTTPTGVPTGSYSGGGAGLDGAGGIGLTTQPTINLPQMYEQMYKDLGIREAEADLSQKEKEFIEAQGKINDNPFLSEATRVGRVAKLDQLYQQRTANIRGDIATKKADAETRLNLQLKQFDIQSQQAQQALQQFNTLLSIGALDNAGGEDIANLTRSTGIASSMIYSAIEANKAKNAVKPQMVSYDDGNTQGFVMIDPMTGEIINKQVVASSKQPSGGASGVLSSAISTMTPEILRNVNDYGHLSPQDWQKAKASWLGQGLRIQDFIDNFSGYADTNRGDFETAYGFTNPNPVWRGNQRVGSYDEEGNIIK